MKEKATRILRSIIECADFEDVKSLCYECNIYIKDEEIKVIIDFVNSANFALMEYNRIYDTVVALLEAYNVEALASRGLYSFDEDKAYAMVMEYQRG